MEEIGRTGWLMLGIAGMTTAGVAHAVSGAVHIAKDMVRAPKSAQPGVQGMPAEDELSGAGGWVLFAAVLLAAEAARHVVAAARDLGREILTTAHPV